MKTVDFKHLVDWIEYLKEVARDDDSISISLFNDTKDNAVSIVGGWCSGFSEDYSDLLCISKSNPAYAMCVKIAINEGPYAYTDFELMNMPVDPETNEVDDTCIALEYNDDARSLAEFLISELDRIQKTYSKIGTF